MATTKKATVVATTPPADPQEMVSLRALTPLRLDGQDVAELASFEAEVGVAAELVQAGLAEAVSTDPAFPKLS